MTSYSVQFTLPVENPEMKCERTVNKHHMVFYIPINHKDAHKMSFLDLMAACDLSGLRTISTPHNKRGVTILHSPNSKGCELPSTKEFRAAIPKP